MPEDELAEHIQEEMAQEMTARGLVFWEQDTPADDEWVRRVIAIRITGVVREAMEIDGLGAVTANRMIARERDEARAKLERSVVEAIERTSDEWRDTVKLFMLDRQRAVDRYEALAADVRKHGRLSSPGTDVETIRLNNGYDIEPQDAPSIAEVLRAALPQKPRS